MSDLKMSCPSCGSSTTAIRTAAEDGEPCPHCGRALPDVGPVSEPTPPVTASRDALRSTLADHFIMWRELDEGPRGEWFCACGLKFGFSDSAIDHQTDALAGVVRAVDGLAEDEALVKEAAESVTDAHWCESNYTRGCNCGDYRAQEARSVLRALAAALATPTDPSEA